MALLFIFALFFMKEHGFTPLKEKKSFISHLKRITKNSIEMGWNQKTLRFFMLISFFQSAFLMWGFYASQPYLLDLIGNREAVWISGLVAASLALAQIAGNSLVTPMIKKTGKPRYSLVEVKPKTGRYHQIRRHMARIGHPVLGDTSHGDLRHNRIFEKHYSNERLLLHSTQITFIHPVSDEKMTLKAPLPSNNNTYYMLYYWCIPYLWNGSGY